MEQNVFEQFRSIALSLPGMVESITHGTPSFKLKDKLLARFHQDGKSLALKTDFDTRDFLLQAHPDVYYITDHYKDYPYILVRMSAADMEELKGLVHRTWKSLAPKKLLLEYEKLNPLS